MLRNFRNFAVTVFAFAVVFSILPKGLLADDLLLVDVHRLPIDCKTPNECVDQSSPMMTNILSLSRDETAVLSRVLNSSAVVRSLPRATTDRLCRGHRAEELHDIPVAEKLTPLVDHPGVLFNSERLDSNELTNGFAGEVRALLKRLGLRLLTEEEWEETPGRPTLSVSFSPRKESEGCIIPYSVSFSIKEEVVMVRDPSIKLTTNVWSALAKENLANLNYTARSALNELLKKFEKDYLTANPAN